MIRAILFLLKIGLVIAAVMWVAERPGTVQVDWLDYTFTIHVGLFLLALLGVVAVCIFLYQAYRAFVGFPAAYKYYNEIKGREKGYRALTLGLTAVAAGDTKTAMKQADKACKFLPEDGGLPLLLQAQAARLDGREEDAHGTFVALLEHKDASFLGVRGLLQSSLDRGDYDGALALAQKALALHPKQPWILRTVYDLQIRLRRWNDARVVLDRAVKAGAISKDRAKRDKVAMALALAIEAQDEGLHDVVRAQFKAAQKLDPSFVPRVMLQADYYVEQGQQKKAISLIEKAWKASPHPAYLSLWVGLVPDASGKDAAQRLRMFERFAGMSPKSADGQMAVGLAAMEAGLWGEARRYFERAEEIEPRAALYKAFADLEQRASHGADGGEVAAMAWLEKAADAPGEKLWVCRETGRVYDMWAPVAEPHGSFNTIEWAYPFGDAGMADAVLLTDAVGEAIGGAKNVTDDLDDTLIEMPQIPPKVA